MLDVSASEAALRAEASAPLGDAGNPYQRTADWYKERCGCLTGSRVAAALSRLKSGQRSQAAKDMIIELATERLTGSCVEHYTTRDMQWGTDHEAEAREAYEAETGRMVELAGFVHHPSVEWLGASPDGLVGDDGMVEIKCPTSMTHVRRLLDPQAGVAQYRMQMLLQLACTGRTWCDFAEYDPRMRDEALRLQIVRFEPTVDEIVHIEVECREFLAEVEEAVRQIKEAGNV